MSRKKLKIFLPVIALFLAALACGGSSQVTLADIPVYPGVSVLETGQNEMADQLASVVAESAGAEGVTSEVELFIAPSGASWSDVRSYFTGELTGGDWEQDADLTQESEFFNSIGWTRGGLSSQQALVVGFTMDPFSGDSIILISLFTE